MTPEEKKVVDDWIREHRKAFYISPPPVGHQIVVPKILFGLLRKKCREDDDRLGRNYGEEIGTLLFQGIPVVSADEDFPEPDVVIGE